jgi:2,3-bisphosphoglycerate-independent phosphoglycerate mutase
VSRHRARPRGRCDGAAVRYGEPESFREYSPYILDGLADRPQAVLGGKTPLEASHTPHLDRLAKLGTNGLLVPLSPGIPLESEFSHFLLFGYPPDYAELH